MALQESDTFGLAAEGALHSYRGDPLAERDEDTRECIGQCHDLLDTSRITVAWDRAVDVQEYAGRRCGCTPTCSRATCWWERAPVRAQTGLNDFERLALLENDRTVISSRAIC